jgi:hypothetical protein
MADMGLPLRELLGHGGYITQTNITTAATTQAPTQNLGFLTQPGIFSMTISRKFF